jgi:hypothetical protein
MVLSTLRKEYVLGGVDQADLEEWIAAMAKARATTIKQELGHAPISATQAFANRSGEFLTQKGLERENEAAEESRRGRFEG